jgi:hypothetical protein
MFVNVKIYVETKVYRLSTLLFRGPVNNDLGVSHSQPHCEDILTVRKEVYSNNFLQIIKDSTTSNTSHSFRRKTS